MVNKKLKVLFQMSASFSVKLFLKHSYCMSEYLDNGSYQCVF